VWIHFELQQLSYKNYLTKVAIQLNMKMTRLREAVAF